MTELIRIKGTNTWVAKGVDCGESSTTCILTFSHSGNTSLGTVSVGDQPVGVIAMSSWVSPDCSAMGKISGKNPPAPVTEAQCEIDPISGVQDITVTVQGQAKLHSIAFTDKKPYADVTYTPVPEKSLVDLASETWEATDMLGRKVASVEDVKGKTHERKVGIFYWTWQESHAHLRPVDVTKVLEKYPSAEYREDHPAWGERPMQCFWHEPFYGFYRNSDPYIIRHHAALLSAAGVDMIAFDCTNGALLWRDAYEPLLKGLHEARLDGIRTPQIVFMLNFGPMQSSEAMIRSLYQNLYKPGLYADLWYCMDGKPVIMGYPEALPRVGVCETDTRILDEIRNFFCFRPGQPGYGCGPSRPDHWGWLEIFPQHKYGERPDGTCEMMTVGVGQNANKDRICTHFNDVDTFGRSYTGKEGHALMTPDSYKYGYNVQEQWDRAIDMDPDMVFVTGWNEWIMGQWKEPWLSDPESPQLAMVDQYNREHSRDIEMDRDGYLDTYYLQLAHNIRRYKGAKTRVKVSEPQTVNVSGGETQWKKVTPVYRNPKGTTIHRDWDGFAGCHYVNTTGRNDIVEAKVTRDEDNVYFFVKCADAITPREGDSWMTLFLDTDRSKATGWEGYDLAINRLAAPKGKCVIERYVPTADAGSFTWEKIGTGKLHVKGNTLTLSVPRTLVGMSGKLDFEFKWSDNMQAKDVMDFYENGDTAPIGRFNYLYKE